MSRRVGLVAAFVVAAFVVAAWAASAPAGATRAGMPLVIRAANARAVGGRLIGQATIADSGRAPARRTVGYLTVSSGGGLTGVARFSLPALRAGGSRTVRFGTRIVPAAWALRPGRYALLVCVDVDSQLAPFAVGRNCRQAGTAALRGGAVPRRGPPPNTAITDGTSGVTTTGSAHFTFVSTAAGSPFQCRLDGGPWISCRSPSGYTSLVDGVHTFDVRAINRARGVDPTPAHASWVTAMLARVPYMGWNTYYGVGGIFDEGTILSVANALLDRGLARAGYRIVWLDFGWATGARDRHGNLLLDAKQWPHGLAWLTGWLHGRGLEAGIYTDAGSSGCHGRGVGSLGHYQQDVDAFAAWGFDAVKVDFCGAGQEGLTPERQYTEFAQALANNASRRPILLNVCNFWVPGQIDGTRPSFANSAYANYRWARRFAQSWRTDTDIGFTRDVKFVNVLRNMDHDAAHPDAAGPGHWNDPDYLGPELGMTAGQAQAQLSMWAILAAPLILGSDPRAVAPETVAMLRNRAVIAIDQDPLGVQGRLLSRRGDAQVWVKPLAGGARAVALLNRGPGAVRIATTARAIGLGPARRYAVADVWRHGTRRTSGAISAVVAPGSVVLYRVTRA
jgi:hypothetical protein